MMYSEYLYLKLWWERVFAKLVSRKKKTRSRPCKVTGKQNVDEFLFKFMEARRCQQTIVSIDETGFDDNSLPCVGYSPKGSRLVIKHTRTSWKRTSAIAAICTSGTSNYSLSDKPVNGDTFECFLASLDLPVGSLLLMDNIAFHKMKKVRDLVSTKGWQILFTPPYSPWFNPIENVFSVAKHAFRSANARDLAQGVSSGVARHAAVRNAFASVTPELVAACFKHVDKVCLSEISRTHTNAT